MSYLSLTFVAFVALLMILYYVVPKKARGVFLLLGSIVFYGLYDLKYFAFLLATAGSTYLAARVMDKVHHKKLLVALVVIFNAGIWFVIKEVPWLAAVLNHTLLRMGIVTDPQQWNWIVPVGISYYTLQAIGYLVDVSKGKIQAEKRFWKYLLFLSWFPAIVQGPISRYDQLMPQLLNEKRYSFDTMRDSLVRILFGLVKKMVIADRLAIFVNTVFKDHLALNGVILYLGAVGYAFQLYLDFSGCVDICRGVSGLFGVELVNNFNRPYLARSIKDFWGKWHMSLSSWLKDYVYIPLGGNRKGTIRKYLNLMITFLVSGLWHGAGYNFFLWGAIHGLYQIFGQSTYGIRCKIKKWIGIEEGSLSERIYQTIITFNLVTLAWIVFRAGNIPTSIQYVTNMFTKANWWVLFDGSLYTFGLSQNYIVFLAAHICGLFALELCTKKQDDVVQTVNGLHLFVRWALYLVLIFDVLLFGVYGSGYDPSSFLYGGF